MDPMRSAPLLLILLLAAALPADGADGDTTALVADTASAAMPLTGDQWQYFSITPLTNETVTFTYTSTTGADLKAYAKRGGCPTATDFDFENDRYSGVNAIGEVYVDPCSGSGEICFGVTYWAGDVNLDTSVTATATVSTAAGATDVLRGSTFTMALHSGMNNFKLALPENFDSDASFLRVSWENLDDAQSSAAEFFVNQAGMCATQKDPRPETVKRYTTQQDGMDTALTLAGGSVVHFGIESWGAVTYHRAVVTLEPRTCDAASCK
ncbi:hypothetical protein T484DRAFT_1774548, partial [Baffinella frigidus]